MTGRWVGSIDSNAGPPGFEPVFGTYTLTLQLTQSGGNVTGPMTTDIHLAGTFAGGLSGKRIVGRVAVEPCGGPTNAPGVLNFSGTVDDPDGGPPSMQVSYQGTACGVGDYGQGTLTRQ